MRVSGNKYIATFFFFKHHPFGESITLAVAIKKKNKVVKTKTNSSSLSSNKSQRKYVSPNVI